MLLNQTNKRIGEILLELGYLVPRDLYSGLKQQVNDIYEKIHTMNYYEILGIDGDISQSEIKKRYLEMLKDFHPDRHSRSLDASMKEKLTAITTLLNKAYKILGDETKRFKYDSSLQRWSQKKTVGIKVINAERHFKKGNFLSAIDLFLGATLLNSQKAIYYDYLSLTLNNIRRHKEVEQFIMKAIELEPYNADYYVHLGLIYLKAGLKKRAQQQFKTALEWDSTNIDAQTELKKLKS